MRLTPLAPTVIVPRTYPLDRFRQNFQFIVDGGGVYPYSFKWQWDENSYAIISRICIIHNRIVAPQTGRDTHLLIIFRRGEIDKIHMYGKILNNYQAGGSLYENENMNIPFFPGEYVDISIRCGDIGGRSNIFLFIGGFIYGK